MITMPVRLVENPSFAEAILSTCCCTLIHPSGTSRNSISNRIGSVPRFVVYRNIPAVTPCVIFLPLVPTVAVLVHSLLVPMLEVTVPGSAVRRVLVRAVVSAGWLPPPRPS